MPLPNRKLLLRATGLLLLAFAIAEALFWYQSYQQLHRAGETLRSLSGRLELSTVESNEIEVKALQESLREARGDLAAVRRHVAVDPLLRLAGYIPYLSNQATGFRHLVSGAEASAIAGAHATDVLLAYQGRADDPELTSVQEGLHFLQSQTKAMGIVRLKLDEMKEHSDASPDGLLGPLNAAKTELDQAIDKLDGLVSGYEQANQLLPEMLGLNGPRRYLVLAQNNTELFPSGGLISNYGIATFDQGRLAGMDFEYFINLFDRWQALAPEYVDPPDPLRNYLLRHVSWGLGEAGWYPDFPTTADLATSFVEKGGAEPVDGVIAIDLLFVQELLRLMGPVHIEEHAATIDADNLNEMVLELTRGERNYPGSPGKGFLSDLAKTLLDRIFSAPKEQWVDLLRLLDMMARERHLQMNFNTPALQDVAVSYGLDGAIVRPQDGDFILIADTSVNSTKLNLILETEAAVIVRLTPEGTLTQVSYSVSNPFPSWRAGRDPRLVSALMHEGVYGSYLRVYTREEAQFVDLRLDGKRDGPEQAGVELGLRSFGRFFPVLPGERRRLDISYFTPGTVQEHGSRYSYRLYIQKQPGTQALPLSLRIETPNGATIEAVRLDGRDLGTQPLIRTDLAVDRVLEVVWRAK